MLCSINGLLYTQVCGQSLDTSIVIRPHQVDFLFHGPAGPKKLNFQKKKKNFFITKRSARDQMWSISATAVSVYNAV